MSRAPELPRLVNFSDSDMSTDSDEESREGSSACNVMPGYVSANVTPRVDKNPQMTNIHQDTTNKPMTYSSVGGSNNSKNDNNTKLDINESSLRSHDSRSFEKEDSRERKIDNKRGSSRGRRSRSGGRKRSLSGSLSSRSRSGSRGRSRSKDRSRSRSRGRRRSGSRGRRSGSRGRRSGSRSRRSSSRGRRSRSKSRERRSRSGSRGRYRRRSRSRSHGKYRRRSRHDDRRRRSPYRRRSPPRAHKTLDTLEKLGIELKPPPPPSQDAEPYIPPYYNRLAVNPTKYAQQIAKRKLIWGHKNTEEAKSTSWQGAAFSQDQDGKMTAKFKRLMGIKVEEQASTSNEKGEDLIKRQQELFSSMELQYEAARQATHTQRGVGLGFSSHPHHFPPT